MFWQYEMNISTFDQLFDQDEPPILETVFSDVDFLTELKSNNPKLTTFLSREENVSSMINYLITEPSVEINEKIRYKYLVLSAEVFIIGISSVDFLIFDEYKHIKSIWGFIKNTENPNILMVGYIVKVLIHYISMHFDSMIKFFKQCEPEFISHLIKHISLLPISELILHMLNGTNRIQDSYIHDMFKQSDMANELAKLISITSSDEKAYGASSMIVEFIRMLKLTPDIQQIQFEYVFFQKLSSPEYLDIIVKNLNEAKDREAISFSCANVLNALFNLQRVGHLNGEEFVLPSNLAPKFVLQYQIDLSQFTHNIEIILNIVKNKSKDVWLNPSGGSWLKLGLSKLLMIETLVALLLYRDEVIESEFIRLNIFPFILELFVQYPHNNFLHTQLQILLICILECSGWGCTNGRTPRDTPISTALIENLFQTDFITNLIKLYHSKEPYSAHIKDITRVLIRCSKEGIHKDLIAAKIQVLPADLCEQFKEIATLLSHIDEIETVDKHLDANGAEDRIDDEINIPVFLSMERGFFEIKKARAEFAYEDDIDNIENAFEVEIGTSLQSDEFIGMNIKTSSLSYSTEVYDSMNIIAEESITSSDDEKNVSLNSSHDDDDSNLSNIKMTQMSESVPILNITVDKSHNLDHRCSSFTDNDCLRIPCDDIAKHRNSDPEPKSDNNSLGIKLPTFTRGGTSSPVPEDYNLTIEHSDPFESEDSLNAIQCNGL